MRNTLSTLMTLLVLVVLVAGCTAGVQAPVGDAEVNATGRAVFVITDAAANMGSVSSIKVTVDSVSVHSASEGWVAVLSTPGTYDLLQLKAEGKNALLADVQLEEGRYEQARLQISKVVVTDAEGSREAKLPSGELKVVGNLEVDANTTSTATFEFIADESLHVTGSGEYVMAPVVKVETRHDADVEVRSGSDVVVSGGSVTASSKVGMDISGNVGVGLKIGLNETLDIENGKIKIGIGMPVSVAGKGRLVVGVTDKAVKASSVSSVMVTVDNVSVHNSAKGWVDVSLTPRTFDLVQLNATSTNELLADVNIEPGTYEQVRLGISKVMVTDANGTREAKVPSGEMKIAGRVVVNENGTATALLDFILDESLHMTGSGEYILAPVIRLETRENAAVEVRSGNKLLISGGKLLASTKVGMDASGKVGVGIKIKPQQNVSIVSGRVTITEQVSAGGGGGY